MSAETISIVPNTTIVEEGIVKDDRGTVHEKAVADGLNNASAVARHAQARRFVALAHQPGAARFVFPYQARIADHVGE